MLEWIRKESDCEEVQDEQGRVFAAYHTYDHAFMNKKIRALIFDVNTTKALGYSYFDVSKTDLAKKWIVDKIKEYYGVDFEIENTKDLAVIDPQKINPVTKPEIELIEVPDERGN